MCLNIPCSFPDFLKHIPKANDKDEIELGSSSKLKFLIVLSLAFIRDQDYFLKWYPVNSQNSFLINSVRRKSWVLPFGLICINGSCNGFSVGFCSKRHLLHSLLLLLQFQIKQKTIQAAVFGLILFLDDIVQFHTIYFWRGWISPVCVSWQCVTSVPSCSVTNSHVHRHRLGGQAAPEAAAVTWDHRLHRVSSVKHVHSAAEPCTYLSLPFHFHLFYRLPERPLALTPAQLLEDTCCPGMVWKPGSRGWAPRLAQAGVSSQAVKVPWCHPILDGGTSLHGFPLPALVLLGTTSHCPFGLSTWEK